MYTVNVYNVFAHVTQALFLLL